MTGKLTTRYCREDYGAVELPGDEGQAVLFSAVDPGRACSQHTSAIG